MGADWTVCATYGISCYAGGAFMPSIRVLIGDKSPDLHPISTFWFLGITSCRQTVYKQAHSTKNIPNDVRRYRLLFAEIGLGEYP